MSPRTLGKNPTAVKSVESFTSAPFDTQNFHLNTTFVAHQKLATLSSKRPRAKGNIRIIGCMISERGVKGGRKGRKRMMNEARVVTARRKKSSRLEDILSAILWTLVQ